MHSWWQKFTDLSRSPVYKWWLNRYIEKNNLILWNNNYSPEKRIKALRKLHIHPGGQISINIGLKRDTLDSKVRKAVAEGLGYNNSSMALSELTKMLEDNDAEVRDVAVDSILRIAKNTHGKGVTPMIFGSMKSSDNINLLDGAAKVIGRLEKLSERELEDIIDMFLSEDVVKAATATIILATRKEERIVSLMIDAVKTIRSEAIRQNVGRVLAAIGVTDKQMDELLKTLTSDELNAHCKKGVAKVIGRIAASGREIDLEGIKEILETYVKKEEWKGERNGKETMKLASEQYWIIIKRMNKVNGKHRGIAGIISKDKPKSPKGSGRKVVRVRRAYAQ